MSFQNKLSWSHSTQKVFEACPRQYWFKKFGGWGGWEDKEETERRRIWLLGKVKNRWMWKGEVIHSLIENIIRLWRNGQTPTEEHIRDMALERFRNDFRNSRAGLLLQGSSKVTALAEHVFDRDIDEEKWKILVDDAVELLVRFSNSDVAAEVKAVPGADMLALEKLDEMQIDGVTVYVKMDAAWKDSEGRAVITDWKTGKGETDEEGVSSQLGLYAVYAEQKWGLSAVVREYHLKTGHMSTWTPTDGQKASVVETVRGHIETIRPLIKDGPGGIEGKREDFPATPSMRVCGGCNYFQLCSEASMGGRSVPNFP